METEIRDLEERIKSTDAMVCWLLVYYTCDVLNLVELDYSNDCDVFWSKWCQLDTYNNNYHDVCVYYKIKEILFTWSFVCMYIFCVFMYYYHVNMYTLLLFYRKREFLSGTSKHLKNMN